MSATKEEKVEQQSGKPQNEEHNRLNNLEREKVEHSKC